MMKFPVAAATIVGCAMAAASSTHVGLHVREHVGSSFSQTVLAQQAAPARSVWDGVYTLAQAKRGALKSGLCITCHGDEFKGDPAPDLAGPDFLMRWDGRTLGDLFDLIRLTMPDDDPGALPREQYADLVGYILALNKFPTGSTEIGIDTAPLKEIRILATKP